MKKGGVRAKELVKHAKWDRGKDHEPWGSTWINRKSYVVRDS